MTVLSDQKACSSVPDHCQTILDFPVCCSPRTILCCCFAGVCCYTLLALVVSPIFFPDSSEYVALVEAFRQGAYDRAFPQHLPVLYTVLAGVIAKCGFLSSLSALILVNGLATALSVFPVYGVLKKCVPARWAAWGTLLCFLFPLLIECTVCPLLDSVKLLFFFSGLYLIFNCRKKIELMKLLALGCVYGCLVLGRAEGILLTGILCCVLFCKIISAKYDSLLRKVAVLFLSMLIPLIVMLVICAPRMIQMYNETGYPVIDSRQSNAVKGILAEIGQTEVMTSDNTLVTYEEHGGYGTATCDIKVLTQENDFLSAFLLSVYYPYFPFILLGIFILIKQKKKLRAWNLLLIAFLLFNLMYFFLRVGLARYMLLNVIFTMPICLIGCHAVWLWLQHRNLATRKRILIPLGCFVIGSIIHFLVLFFSQDYEGFKQVGECLETESKRNAGVDRPVVLLIATDYGLGYYSDLNVIGYDKFGLLQSRSPEDILRNGVPLKYLAYGTQRDLPETLHVDAIVIHMAKYKEAVSHFKDFVEEPIVCGDLTIFKVKKHF